MSPGNDAELYLDDVYVGDVSVHGREGSWSHGRFRPQPAFAAYEALFAKWSSLIHADGVYEPLSSGSSDELRQTEYAIDRLNAKLRFKAGEWVKCWQLNIDGLSIEWKCN